MRREDEKAPPLTLDAAQFQGKLWCGREEGEDMGWRCTCGQSQSDWRGSGSWPKCQSCRVVVMVSGHAGVMTAPGHVHKPVPTCNSTSCRDFSSFPVVQRMLSDFGKEDCVTK